MILRTPILEKRNSSFFEKCKGHYWTVCGSLGPSLYEIRRTNLPTRQAVLSFFRQRQVATPSSPGKGAISRKTLGKIAKCNESKEIYFRCTTHFLGALYLKLPQTTSNFLLFCCITQFIRVPPLAIWKNLGKIAICNGIVRVYFRCT
jgi:hypothetical protein